MDTKFVTYAFDADNKNTLVFIPGFSGGLEVGTIADLVHLFVEKGDIDVLGIDLDYANDTIDVFPNTQKELQALIDGLKQEFPEKNIILLGKSLGGALALHSVQTLPIEGLVVLGSSVVLGWPQRISLLSVADPQIPDYKSEWGETIGAVAKPVLIFTGETDDLSDNAFLFDMAESNDLVDVCVVPQAEHNLKNINTNAYDATAHAQSIERFITSLNQG